MDKKTLFALLLILVVFWISSKFIWKPAQQNTQQASQPTSKPEVEEPAQNIKQEEALAAEDITKTLENEEVQDIPVNNNLVLENEKMIITFSNQGAVINSVKLKDYLLADKENLVDLIPAENSILGIKYQNRNGDLKNLENRIFQYHQETDEISFYTNIDGKMIEKTYFLTAGYGLELDVKIDNAENLSSYYLGMESGINDTEKYLKTKTRDYKVKFQLDNEIDDFELSELQKESQTRQGKLDWIGIKSKYFTMVMILNDLILTEQFTASSYNESPAMKIQIENEAASIDQNYKLYFGPLLSKDLLAYGKGVENLVEMGFSFLQWLSRIFKIFLQFLNNIVPNWGIDIIIFAIILKVLLYPLTHKAFESTTKMQKVQPLIKEIQAKYKGDPQTMNAEMKKLYKEHGVNPLGGCLPMLLQMPVIFALYPILRYSISLRQASFLWLPDLSEPDPVWALPILMAVFMFVQQKLMAPSKDATKDLDEKAQAAQKSQQMMMYVMPVMMFFIFKGRSSGLVLYWTLFSVIGSIQQYFIKKKFK